ncbi:MAG: hypothetical protein AABW46_00110 [Nanoarchaeota archaeon]
MGDLSLPERLYQQNPERFEKIPDKIYREIHSLTTLMCVDGYVKIRNGVLLVHRAEEPAKGIWWPLGGRRIRGLSRSNSIIKAAKRETGLDVEIIEELGTEDVFFNTDPPWLGHGMGTDTTNTVYALKLIDPDQEVIIDKTISNSRIITPEEYDREKGSFHWYVEKYLPMVFSL